MKLTSMVRPTIIATSPRVTHSESAVDNTNGIKQLFSTTILLRIQNS
jgi:hypothetical protein